MTVPIQATIDFFNSLVGLLSSSLALTVIVIGYLLTHPEKVEKWHSLGARAFSYLSDRAKRAAVSSDIQSEINSFAKSLNSESDGGMPYGLKIEWTRETSREAFIQAQEVIVRMKHHSDQPRNMVYAALAYVSRGFLPHGRHYMGEKIARSADHIVTRRILVQRNLGDALHLYVSEFLGPELEKDSVIKDYCQIFETLDGEGWFAKIFTREVERLGLKLHPSIPTSAILRETGDFLDFLKTVVEREPGKEVPGGTLFIRPHLKLALALIARADVLATLGVAPHLSWIAGCWEKGVDTVYVIARGSSNVKVAQQITSTFSQAAGAEKLSEVSFTSPKPDGKSVRYFISVLRKRA